jgi:hypothetical protein
VFGHELFGGQIGDLGEGFDHLRELYLGDLSITGIIGHLKRLPTVRALISGVMYDDC